MNEYLRNESSLAPYMVFPRFLFDAEVNEKKQEISCHTLKITPILYKTVLLEIIFFVLSALIKSNKRHSKLYITIFYRFKYQ